MYRTNQFQDRIKAEFGIPRVIAEPGESFDAFNDCVRSDCGNFITFRHNGFAKRGDAIDLRRYHSVGAAMMEALMTWEKRHNSPRAFAEEHRQDPTEFGFGG